MQALYYKAGKDRLLTLVLTRDATGKRPDALFYCTRLAWDARTILSTYADRWPLEQVLQEGKGEVGLGHDEVRSWVGWHHHMTLSMLALWFLTLERRRLGKKHRR